MKRTLLSALLALWSFACCAQDEASEAGRHQWYLRLGAGYSVAHASQNDIDGQILDGNASFTTAYSRYQTNKVSFGSGPNASLALGYMFSDFFGVELGVNAGVFSRKHKYQMDVFYSPGETGVGEGRIYSKTRLTVMPSVVLRVPVGDVHVYSRLGLALPVMGRITREYTEMQTTLGGQYELASLGEYRTMFAVGTQGAIGVQFPTGGGSFWVEINGISMNAYARSFKYTKYTVNGTDVLGTMVRADKEIEYDFDVTDFTSASSPDEVGKAKTFSIPFSNIGAAVGLNFAIR